MADTNSAGAHGLEGNIWGKSTIDSECPNGRLDGTTHGSTCKP